MQLYVFSRSLHGSPDPAIQVISEEPAARIKQLKNQVGKDIWLCGGAQLATFALNEGLHDEIIVKQNPVLFGTGKSLCSEKIGPRTLQLLHRKEFENGVVALRYGVSPA